MPFSFSFKLSKVKYLPMSSDTNTEHLVLDGNNKSSSIKRRSLLRTITSFLSACICADNFFTRTKDNIKHLLTDPYFEVIRHDICQPLYIEIDEKYHFTYAHYQAI